MANAADVPLDAVGELVEGGVRLSVQAWIAAVVDEALPGARGGEPLLEALRVRLAGTVQGSHLPPRGGPTAGATDRPKPGMSGAAVANG